MHVFLDYEVRSLLNPMDDGVSKYARHSSTLPLMLAWKQPKRRVGQWVLDLQNYDGGIVPCPDKLLELVNSDCEFHAHNAQFEYFIWNYCCVPRWGWPPLPIERWWCTAAKASASNLPRALGKVCKLLEVEDGKDATGKELLQAMCQPQKAYVSKRDKNKQLRPDSVTALTEAGVELFELPDTRGKFWWRTDPLTMSKLAAYNRQDVIAEEHVDRRLPNLHPTERELWILDQKINERGFPVDYKLCRSVLGLYKIKQQEYNDELSIVCYDPDTVGTKAAVEKATQFKRLKDWVAKHCMSNGLQTFGLDESMDQDHVAEFNSVYDSMTESTQAMYQTLHDAVRLKSLASGTAVAKYKAALESGDTDGRARGQLLYHGAATGRWTGKHIQPHNFLRKAIPSEEFFTLLKSGVAYETIRDTADMMGWELLKLIKHCVRGLIRAESGTELVVSDLSGIETRVLQWLAKGYDMLDFISKGGDPYLKDACGIYEMNMDTIAYWSDADNKFKVREEHGDKRQMGKVATLSLGYGSGAVGFISSCKSMAGIDIDHDTSAEIVGKWRSTNERIVQLWYRLERACKAVIRNKSTVARVDYVYVHYQKPWLCIRLPSGRDLRYFKACVNNEGQVAYVDGNKGFVDTYGGKLVENVTQAVARDVLAHGMLLADKLGLFLIGHVHDEIITQSRTPQTDLQILDGCLRTVPIWATGLPLSSEGYHGKRYTK